MLTFLWSIGNRALGIFRGVGEVTLLLLDVIRWIVWSWPPRAIVVRQLYFVGVESLPVVATTGAFTGMVLAYQSHEQFATLGIVSWTGPLVAKSLIMQLGPVLAGVMLAGRVGCAMAAELGTMVVTEQVDALKTMGADPVKYLVMPRVVAFTLMTPVLTGFAMAVGIAAGFALTIYGQGAEAHFMWEQTKILVVNYDFVQGLLKALFFGMGIALICCLRGLATRGGAEGVGQATTEANVYSCIYILVSNLFLTILLLAFA
jgi:phospholipid/cholesterol/gamma-HCH transport system permease protein